MTAVNSSKRWYLRTWVLLLFAFVLVVTSGVLAIWWPYYREQRAVAYYEARGDTCVSDIVRPGWIPDWFDDENLGVFARVRFVKFSDAPTDGSSLRYLEGLSNVGVILFDDNRWISDQELQHLRELSSLTVLSLRNTQITDEGLRNLQGLEHLRELHLDNTQVSDNGLKHLRGLARLQELDLRNTQIADNGLKHLSELTNLDILVLDNTRITDDGIKHLRELRNVKLLDLSGTHVSDAGLDDLIQLDNVVAFNIRNTRITEAGYVKLLNARPDCSIQWNADTP